MPIMEAFYFKFFLNLPRNLPKELHYVLVQLPWFSKQLWYNNIMARNRKNELNFHPWLIMSKDLLQITKKHLNRGSHCIVEGMKSYDFVNEQLCE